MAVSMGWGIPVSAAPATATIGLVAAEEMSA
jgi:hypothetical protein